MRLEIITQISASNDFFNFSASATHKNLYISVAIYLKMINNRLTFISVTYKIFAIKTKMHSFIFT